MTTDTAAPARRTTYAEVFAVREFRVLFGGNVAAILAETMSMLALSVLVFQATRSPLWSAVAFTAGFLPQAVGGAFLLSLADRLPPRAAIIAGNLVRVAVCLVIAATPLPVGGALAVVLAAGCVRPVFGAAATALLPEVLEGDRYVLGRSAFTIAMSAAQIASLGGGGVLLAVFGANGVMYVAAVLAAVGAAWTYAGLRSRPPRRAGRESPVRETMRRNRTLLAHPVIRRFLLGFWLPVSFLTGAESLSVAYIAGRGYGTNVGAWLLATLPVGMLVGNLVVGRALAPATRERLAFPLVLVVGLPLLPLALPVPMWLAFPLVGVSAAGLAYELGLQRAFVDEVAVDVRGQAMGLLSTGLMTGQGLGALLVGGLADLVGPGPAMAAAGAAIALAGVLVLRRPTRRGPDARGRRRRSARSPEPA
jgi:predicted MFS family arabinose efflux permease